MTRDDVVSQVKLLMPIAASELGSDSAIAAMADSALAEHNQITSDTAVVEATGAVDSISLPSDATGVKSVMRYDSSAQYGSYLVGRVDWWYDSSANEVKLKSTNPANYTLRVTYYKPWTWSTLPNTALTPLSLLTAAYVALQMATLYAGSTRPSISSELNMYRTKSDEWRSISTMYRKMYNEFINRSATATSRSLT